MGAEGSSPPASVTCAGCLGMWWLESSCDPADPRRVRMREVPADVAPLPDHVPDWPPGDLEPPALRRGGLCLPPGRGGGRGLAGVSGGARIEVAAGRKPARVASGDGFTALVMPLGPVEEP